MAEAAATGLSDPSSPSTTIVLHDATVILLCGLPASGKSQLARQVCDYYADHRENDQVNHVPTICHHVEYDLLEQVQFDFQQQQQQKLQHPENESTQRGGTNEEGADSTLRLQAWQQTRSAALQHLQRHLDLDCFLQWNNLDDTTSTSATLSQCLPKLVILMDDNFHLRGMRKQIHRLLWELHQKPQQLQLQQQQQQHANETLPSPRHGWNLHFGILHVDTPPEICRQRNQMRASDQIVSDQVIEKMTRTIEVPPASHLMYWEACWKRIETTTTSSTLNDHQDIQPNELLNDVIEFIGFCHPIAPVQIEDKNDYDNQKEEERQTTRIDAQQTYDQRLRHYVGCVAQWNKTYARAANAARKELLHQHNPTRGRDEGAGATGDCHLVPLFVDLIMALHQEPPHKQQQQQQRQQRQDGNPEHNSETLKSTLTSLLLDG